MDAKPTMLKALHESFSGLTREELKAVAGINENGFRGRLSELMLAGHVRKDSTGERYLLTGAGALKLKE